MVYYLKYTGKFIFSERISLPESHLSAGIITPCET